METAIKKDKKVGLLTPELLDGPMLEHNAWSEKERKEMADWAAKHKLENPAKQEILKTEKV